MSSSSLCGRAHGVKRLKSAPHHPATNGELERLYRPLIQAFNRFLHAGQSDGGMVLLSEFLEKGDCRVLVRLTPSTSFPNTMKNEGKCECVCVCVWGGGGGGGGRGGGREWEEEGMGGGGGGGEGRGSNRWEGEGSVLSQ